MTRSGNAIFVLLVSGSAACSSVRDAVQKVSQNSGSWKISEAEDKLTRETITTATTESGNADKSLVGRLVLECRMPSKQLQLDLDSFLPSGQGLELQDSVAVRVRDAAPLSLTELFSGAENSFAAQTGAVVAAFASGLPAVKGRENERPPISGPPISSPARNVVRVRLDALLGALNARAALLHRMASEPARSRSMQISHLDSLRALRASHGDNDTTDQHLRYLAFGNFIAENLTKVSDRLNVTHDAAAFTRERDSLYRVVQLAKDELDASSIPSDSVEGQHAAALEGQFAAFTHTHFGDISSYKSAADLLRGMGPEVAFQYYNNSRSNTMVLKISEVGSVLDRCK